MCCFDFDLPTKTCQTSIVKFQPWQYQNKYSNTFPSLFGPLQKSPRVVHFLLFPKWNNGKLQKFVSSSIGNISFYKLAWMGKKTINILIPSILVTSEINISRTTKIWNLKYTKLNFKNSILLKILQHAMCKKFEPTAS